MRVVAGCIATLLLVSAPNTDARNGADARDQLDPQRAVILPATVVFDWFGSDAKHITGLWTPSESQLAQMEAALARTLTLKLASYQARFPSDTPIRAVDYYRQYAAVYYKGKPRIAINGFHKYFVEQETAPFDPCAFELYCPDCAPKPQPVPCAPVPGKSSDFWQHEIVTVYDGGSHFFLATYDLDTDVIIEFSFDGSA